MAGIAELISSLSALYVFEGEQRAAARRRGVRVQLPPPHYQNYLPHLAAESEEDFAILKSLARENPSRPGASRSGSLLQSVHVSMLRKAIRELREAAEPLKEHQQIVDVLEVLTQAEMRISDVPEHGFIENGEGEKRNLILAYGVIYGMRKVLEQREEIADEEAATPSSSA